MTDSEELSADELKFAAYANYEYDIQHAYLGDKALPSTTAKVGGDCQIDGNKGRWAMQNGQLVCSPVQQSKYRAPPSSATSPEKQPQRPISQEEWEQSGPLSDDGRALKDAAYEEHRNWLENAWRPRD